MKMAGYLLCLTLLQAAAVAAPVDVLPVRGAEGALSLDLENADGATRLSHLARVPGERIGGEGRGENVDVSSRLQNLCGAGVPPAGIAASLGIAGGTPVPQ